jgi:hypothetical protein
MSVSRVKTRDYENTGRAIVNKIDKTLGSTLWQGGGGGGGGITDGDKGDITITGTGTIWTIDNNVVTYAKMQTASAVSRLIGSPSSGTTLQEITLNTADFVMSGGDLSLNRGSISVGLIESDAKTLVGAAGLVTGATYKIQLDGTSQGLNGDSIIVQAIGIDTFSTSMQYVHVPEATLATIQGTFTSALGFQQRTADPSLTTEGNVVYIYDSSTQELTLNDANPYGIVKINVTDPGEILDTINDGFEGMEFMIFVTGDFGSTLDVDDTGNIKFDKSGATPFPPYILKTNDRDYVKVKKRGSEWLVIGWYFYV